jgi:hypothetical protein
MPCYGDERSELLGFALLFWPDQQRRDWGLHRNREQERAMSEKQPAISMRLASSQSERFIIAALPPAHSRHWIPRHKHAVVKAVHAGVLPLREAMMRYELSLEEFVSWENQFERQETKRRETIHA